MDTSTLFSLAGRTALITGGSRGIGKMVAAGFIAQGAKVYISSRTSDECEATAQELGPDCIALVEDISTVSGCDALAKAYREHEAGLDILVNNAGTGMAAPFEEFTERGWDKVMDINAKSPFFLTQKLHAQLKAVARPDRPAKVINVASIDGMRLSAWETYSYHASKAAILFLTKRMAARLIRDHINVTAVAPGAFATKLNRAARERREETVRYIPSGRIGTDEDIAAAAIFLSSRAGDFIVGETIAVDGGVLHASLAENIEP